MNPVWWNEILLQTIDWSVVQATFPYAADMHACIQDPIHHQEGDVWTHTRMVATEVRRQPIFETDLVGLHTALFHDVAKPATRTESVVDGVVRVQHPSHSRRGAKAAWHDLWALGEPLEARLAVYWLCMWHQKVFHMWEAETEPERLRRALTFATVGDWWKLLAFAQCDTLGRIAPDNQERLQDLGLLGEWIAETLVGFSWPNPWSRQFFLERDDRSAFYAAQEPAGSRVTLMSGLPGSGKDTWLRENRPVLAIVSADDVRRKLGIRPEDEQGQVVQAVREAMRVHLRARTPFAINATNLTGTMRRDVIGLCRDYDAFVEIVALDRPLDTILRQNRERDHAVPDNVIRSLARKWDPPSALEAHEVVWA